MSLKTFKEPLMRLFLTKQVYNNNRIFFSKMKGFHIEEIKKKVHYLNPYIIEPCISQLLDLIDNNVSFTYIPTTQTMFSKDGNHWHKHKDIFWKPLLPINKKDIFYHSLLCKRDGIIYNNFDKFLPSILVHNYYV